MYPSDELLRAAGGRGIPLVISSDAHAAQHVGQLWNEAMEQAVRAGFRKALRLSDRALVPLPQEPQLVTTGGRRLPPQDGHAA
jgi:hypothetical protein